MTAEFSEIGARTLNLQIAANVRAEMARRNIPINRLGEYAGGKRGYWERRVGTCQVSLSMDDIEQLAHCLNVPLARFFVEVEHWDTKPVAAPVVPINSAISGHGSKSFDYLPLAAVSHVHGARFRPSIRPAVRHLAVAR